jgi:hypothetical protein
LPKIRVGGAEIVLQIAPRTARFPPEICKQTFHFHRVSVTESGPFSHSIDRLDRTADLGGRRMTLISMETTAEPDSHAAGKAVIVQ